jgi:hypothetical protein
MEPPTVILYNGRSVAAKIYNGQPCALTYANRTQANRKQIELGNEWEVIRPGRPFYVAKKEWIGSPDPTDPDNFWIDDETGERVNAHTGERRRAGRSSHFRLDK